MKRKERKKLMTKKRKQMKIDAGEGKEKKI